MNAPAPSARQVAIAAEKYPPQFTTALRALFYAMADAVLRHPRRGNIGNYVEFSNVWRDGAVGEDAEYYFGSLDAYRLATSLGLLKLDWSTSIAARDIARELSRASPDRNSVQGLAWRTLIGQVQSIYDRDEAAESFMSVREHSNAALVDAFFRDTGAMTYFSHAELGRRRRDMPSLDDIRNWSLGAEAHSEEAIVVSVDPRFFRIYGPMILHNAQQLPSVDFVIVLCASPDTARDLHRDAVRYLDGLSSLNRQRHPTNVRLIAVDTPEWVANERTFFAAARFLAMPAMLEEYSSIYAVDADLFMVRDPRSFLKKTAALSFGVPRTEGPLGIAPWRRYMAGGVVANRSLLTSEALPRLHDYLSVGLADKVSWMLDQNALTYAVEDMPDYRPLTAARPMVVGNFMSQWERNL